MEYIYFRVVEKTDESMTLENKLGRRITLVTNPGKLTFVLNDTFVQFSRVCEDRLFHVEEVVLNLSCRCLLPRIFTACCYTQFDIDQEVRKATKNQHQTVIELMQLSVEDRLQLFGREDVLEILATVTPDQLRGIIQEFKEDHEPVEVEAGMILVLPDASEVGVTYVSDTEVHAVNIQTGCVNIYKKPLHETFKVVKGKRVDMQVSACK